MTKKEAAVAPLQLVREDGASGGYVVCEEGRRFLSELRAGLPLAVVAVAGRYRTGKSFLLNRGVLGLAPRQGFVTCGSVQACTKGIWIYPALQTGEGGAAFLVLDTEGTASTVASAEQDARLVGISLALASVFIYNSHGAVDETALSELAALTSVASAIGDDGEHWVPPRLFWALRDFTLQLEDEGGAELSGDEYLERALRDGEGAKADARAALRAYFPRRRLFTLVRPCNGEVDLQRLNTLTNSTLRPEFRQQLEAFRAQVRAATAAPREVGGLGLDGPALLQLLEAAVDATNAGRAPSVRSTFDFLLEQRGAAALEDACEELRVAAARLGEGLPLPAPLRLEPPAPPAFLRTLPAALARFQEGVAAEAERLLGELAERNARAGEALARSLLATAAKAEGAAAAAAFGATLAALAARVEPGLVLVCASELHEELAERASRGLRDARSEAKSLGSELEARSRELLQLREELDEALLRSSLQAPSTAEAHEKALAEQAAHFAEELAALAEQRDEQEQRSRQLAREADAAAARALSLAAAARDADALRLHLEEAEAERGEERERCQASLEEERRRQEEDVAALRASFQQVLGQGDARCREAAARAEAAELRLGRGEEALERERQLLEERRRQLQQEGDEQRKAISLALAQKQQLMKESHDALVAEGQRARERASTSERRLLTVEVQAESLKRRLDASQQDSEELAKLRRTHDETRGRLGALEGAAERSASALETQKRLVRQLEDELRSREQRGQEEKRASALRIAQLEMELQSLGVAT
jgi:hypothetical protein